MATCPHSATKTAWENDWLGSAYPPRVAEPYFDKQMDGWILSRYTDVVAAFHSPDLIPAGPTSKAELAAYAESEHLKMRVETKEALSPEALRSWRAAVLDDARSRVAALDWNHPVDLIHEYAEPVCLGLAILATQPAPVSTETLTTLAATVSQSAAEPFDEQLKGPSRAATAELKSFFTAGPEAMRDSGFVALSRTMVGLLGNAWFALLRHPKEWNLLHRRPILVGRGIEELLRFAGPARLLFRRAVADTILNEAHIRKGDRVILRVTAANRDPERFADPQAVSVLRPSFNHLALGAGLHACVGAPLIRVAAIAATLPLVERFPAAQIVEPIEWRGGSGFVFPVSLPVLASRSALSDYALSPDQTADPYASR